MAYDPRQDVLEQVRFWLEAANDGKPQAATVMWDAAWDDLSEAELYDVRDELKLMAGEG